ncbi:Hypothetical predicted protein [Octopus vulgaris]|uniref:Uncharacterized protein n=1 Tax=Octopus vulgaris TaxID=6645 RepID=A0AA36EYE7_OCTVU|nr:Hypothetical predicted protein [Octopus vulgaris]
MLATITQKRSITFLTLFNDSDPKSSEDFDSRLRNLKKYKDESDVNADIWHNMVESVAAAISSCSISQTIHWQI